MPARSPKRNRSSGTGLVVASLLLPQETLGHRQAGRLAEAPAQRCTPERAGAAWGLSVLHTNPDARSWRPRGDRPTCGDAEAGEGAGLVNTHSTTLSGKASTAKRQR